MTATLHMSTYWIGIAVFVMVVTVTAGCSRPLAPSLSQVNLKQMLRDDMGIGSRAEIQVYMLERMESKTPGQKTNFASHYYVGSGTNSDVGKAIPLFQQAAEAGNAKAQFCLAVLYGKGEGVPEKPVEAMKWLLIAERGDGEYATIAKTYRMRLENELSLVRQEIARSISAEWLHLHQKGTNELPRWSNRK